jgi:hypothetical protein
MALMCLMVFYGVLGSALTYNSGESFAILAGALVLGGTLICVFAHFAFTLNKEFSVRKAALNIALLLVVSVPAGYFAVNSLVHGGKF